MTTPQLDLFNDSRDVMLRNDVAHAVLRRDALASRETFERLRLEYPRDRSLDAFALLLAWLDQGAPPRLDRPAAAQAAAAAIEQQLAPAAREVLGEAQGDEWLGPCWQALADAASAVPFEAEHCEGHAAALWLRAGQWQRAADAVTGIASWRRIPAPLAWMAHARYGLHGLDAVWPLLAELAWLAPRRFDRLTGLLADPLLQRLRRRFDAEYEGDGGPDDLAWFPAWVLIEQPALERMLGEAQVQRGHDPERALQLVGELLGFERQGRQRELVAARKELRDLNPSLFRAYMKTR
jgi:hypothetical protein